MKQFGVNIRYYRKQKGYTQRELAERIGVDASSVTSYEKGTVYPRAPKIILIAKTLGVTVEMLFAGCYQL